MSASMHDKRHMIADLDGWTCYYCETPVWCPTCWRKGLPPMVATLDHVMPRSKGGTSALNNLVIACDPCNGKKADLEWPVNVSKRRPKPRRPLMQRAARPVVCRKQRSGTIRKGFPTRELAVAMCTAVWNVHGVDLAAYPCVKCPQWHVTERKAARALLDKGAAHEIAEIAS